MKSVKLPELVTLVHQLSHIKFAPMEDEAAISKFNNTCLQTRTAKYVVRFPNNTLAVRLYLNRCLVVLAYFHDEEFEQAARLADVATLFFHKYRLRKRQLSGYHFNTTREQALNDNGARPEIEETFEKMESALRANGWLPTESQLNARKCSAAQARVTTSLRSQMDTLLGRGPVLDAKLATLHTGLESLKSTFEGLLENQKLIAKLLIDINARLNK